MNRASQRNLPAYVTGPALVPVLNTLLVLLLAVVVLVLVAEAGGQGMVAGPLPGSSQASPGQPSETVALQVDAALGLLLDGRALSHGDLIPALKRSLSVQPDLGVVVHIPASLPAPLLVQVMEALRSAGVRHTAVAAGSPLAAGPKL